MMRFLAREARVWCVLLRAVIRAEWDAWKSE